MPTPLIRKLKDNGTLLVFQSTGEDITTRQGQDELKFTHFACLDIPAIEAPVDGQNTIQFNAIEGSYVTGLSTDSPAPEGDRTDLAESLQNYLLNLEELIIRGENYNPNNPRTVSERIFWKWLKEIGALRFRNAVTGEVSQTLGESRYTEEDINTEVSAGNLYNRVVRYIGNIDIDNSQRFNANSYRQVYIYIPKQAGNTPTPLFKTVADENYGPNQIFQPQGRNAVELIQGRDSGDDNPTSAGLRLDAFYDQDVALGDLDYETDGVPGEIWFASQAAVAFSNSYYTDVVFDDPTTDNIVRSDGGSNTIEYKRSRLDGISLDLDFENSYQAASDNSISSFTEYNQLGITGDFQFNAIAVYYAVPDPETGEDIHNLWGVLFLDNLEIVSTSGAKIPPYQKIKPNRTLGRQGNSFGLTLNTKIDVTDNNVETDYEVSVNDYNTFSMVLFSDAMSQIQLATLNFEKVIKENQELRQRVTDLENQIFTSDNAVTLQREIDALRGAIESTTSAEGTLELVNSLQNQVNEILQGQTSVDLTLLFNVVGRFGLNTSRQQNTLFIDNLRQRYNRTSVINLETQLNNNSNELEVGEWDTLYIHKDVFNDPEVPEDIVLVFLKDSPNRWKRNQVFEIEFSTAIDLSLGISIFTDATNRLGSNDPYSKQILIYSNPEPVKPHIKIICTDPDNLEFETIVRT